MPIFRTVNGTLEPIKLERITMPLFETDVLPSAVRRVERRPHNMWYVRAYVKPENMPKHPHKWRGPRLRRTSRRPSAVPRRYRVRFDRVTP
jgi:hypothetical protein